MLLLLIPFRSKSIHLITVFLWEAAAESEMTWELAAAR